MTIEEVRLKFGNVSMITCGCHSKCIDYMYIAGEELLVISYNSDFFDTEYGIQYVIMSDDYLLSDKFNFDICNQKPNEFIIYVTDKLKER